MTAPPEPRPPEPLMTIWVAAKPGAKPREVLVDVEACDAIIFQLCQAKAGLLAARSAVAAFIAPQTDDDDDVVDATIYCGETALDNAGRLRECQREAHLGRVHRNEGDGAARGVFIWEGDPGDACAECGHLVCDCAGDMGEDVTGSIAESHDADVAAALAASAVSVVLCGRPVWGDEDRPCELIAGHGPVVSCAGKPVIIAGDVADGRAGSDWSKWPDGLEDAAAQDDDGPCMMVGCGHEVALHSLATDTGDRLSCVAIACKCRRYLAPAGLRAERGIDA